LPNSARNFAGSESRFLSSSVCLYSPINIWLKKLNPHSLPLDVHYKPLRPTMPSIFPPKLWKSTT
jgi:hypothetical protein